MPRTTELAVVLGVIAYFGATADAAARRGNQGCCSWHGGVNGCDTRVGRLVCNDGEYSPSCGCHMAVKPRSPRPRSPKSRASRVTEPLTRQTRRAASPRLEMPAMTAEFTLASPSTSQPTATSANAPARGQRSAEDVLWTVFLVVVGVFVGAFKLLAWFVALLR